MTIRQAAPIGIFDSGVGGISICHAIRRTLPSERLIYFADVGFSPYGNKSTELIHKRSEYIANFLVNKGCKAIVVACNTATVNSIKNLRSLFSVPIVGVEPGIKPAMLNSRTGIVGVLATEKTLSSASFQALKYSFSKTVKVEVQACPEFVHLVENLDHQGEVAEKVAEQYIQPLLDKGVDQLILGCTHFSFLRKAIEACVQGRAEIIETAIPVAAELKRRLYELNIHREYEGGSGEGGEEGVEEGGEEFWSSGTASQVAMKINALWGLDSPVREVRP